MNRRAETNLGKGLDLIFLLVFFLSIYLFIYLFIYLSIYLVVTRDPVKKFILRSGGTLEIIFST